MTEINHFTKVLNRIIFQLDGITGTIGTSAKFKYINMDIVQVNF